MRFLWILAWLSAAMGAAAQEMEYGEAEYLLSCAECHGSFGRGDGPLARQLGIEAADLATLQEENNGEFPYLHVYSVIDGRHEAGDPIMRAMPSFGEQFSEKDARQYGPEIGKALTDRRIYALTRYVESLQLPPMR